MAKYGKRYFRENRHLRKSVVRVGVPLAADDDLLLGKHVQHADHRVKALYSIDA